MRFEKPHSLSYQETTRTSLPSSTAVSRLSTVDEAGVCWKSIETSGSSVYSRMPTSGPLSDAALRRALTSSFVVSRFGLKKRLLVLCLCINVPNATFLFLSQTMPTSMTIITAVVIIEQLGWGIGAVGHMIYMMQQIAPGPYKTAHYTFATALMGACMMTTGAVSGYVQKAVGYQWFFVIVLLGAAPSLLATLFAPFHHADVTKQPAKA